jgi:hypothetical protein
MAPSFVELKKLSSKAATVHYFSEGVSLFLLPCRHDMSSSASTTPSPPCWTETSETMNKTNPSFLKLFLSDILSWQWKF